MTTRNGKVMTIVAAALLAILPLALMGASRIWPKPAFPRATAAPAFKSVETASHAEALAYARALDFDTVAGVADRRQLLLNGRPGPIVRIEPERGSFLLSKEDLAEGRIIARLINESDEPYPYYGLEARDTTYWWAENSVVNPRSVYISTRNAGTPVTRPLIVEQHNPLFRWLQALSRWRWNAGTNETGWGTCAKNGCCH